MVEFAPRHPGLNQWRGKTAGAGVAARADIAAAKPTAPRAAAAPMLLRASRPSTMRLMKRCKPLKNAMLILVYILIAAVFLLLVVAFQDPSSTDDRMGVAIYSAILFGLVAWFVRSLWKGVREVKHWRRILNQGSTAEGTVALVEEKRQRLGRWTWKPGWVISYRYRDHAGRSHSGVSGYLSPKEAQRWRSRDQGIVVYDPAQPSNSVWIGKA